MVNSSTIINKMNCYLSHQIIEHRKDHKIWCCISRSWFWNRYKNMMGNAMLPSIHYYY